MTVHLIKMINAVSGKWTVTAAHLGMTENALRNRAYETKGQSLSTEQQLALQQLSGTTYFAEAIAAESGGTFVKLPEPGEIENDSIQALFNQHYADLAASWATFTAAIADGKIDRTERAELEAQGKELHRKMDTLYALMFSVYCPRTNTIMSEVA